MEQENSTQNIQKTAVEQAAYEWAKALCACAGESEEFLEQFWRALRNSPFIFDEFVYYLRNQNFSCKYKVAGYSIVDIMVWQMDHFKAQLDRDRYDMKNNGDRMLLMAFDTMIKMENQPERYVYLMQSETGTDYPEKY